MFYVHVAKGFQTLCIIRLISFCFSIVILAKSTFPSSNKQLMFFFPLHTINCQQLFELAWPGILCFVGISTPFNLTFTIYSIQNNFLSLFALREWKHVDSFLKFNYTACPLSKYNSVLRLLWFKNVFNDISKIEKPSAMKIPYPPYIFQNFLTERSIFISKRKSKRDICYNRIQTPF